MITITKCYLKDVYAGDVYQDSVDGNVSSPHADANGYGNPACCQKYHVCFDDVCQGYVYADVTNHHDDARAYSSLKHKTISVLPSGSQL